MSKIIVKQPTKEELETLGIDNWGTLTCEVSRFDWEYTDRETCYFYEGEVIVEANSEKVEIKAGDLAVFPKGIWVVQIKYTKYWENTKLKVRTV